ncbi:MULTISPECIES: hypothetical protein [Sorangium]|uniref:hypothetical protein n=1 Tax=Sorangium TaxID=39643 RepID=UPI003D9C390E
MDTLLAGSEPPPPSFDPPVLALVVLALVVLALVEPAPTVPVLALVLMPVLVLALALALVPVLPAPPAPPSPPPSPPSEQPTIVAIPSAIQAVLRSHREERFWFMLKFPFYAWVSC